MYLGLIIYMYHAFVIVICQRNTNKTEAERFLLHSDNELFFKCFPQYIHPTDSHKLGQAELVCIDEAAAIPLPLVKSLLGPYLVFMSSTINGWARLSYYSYK